uniref:glycine betaine ABC transporter substrate-binding protein n=1 Tax=Okeania sp. SIO2F4 TaxID=2607790 RepID=UPI0025D2DB6F|nr:glycine betaine ABC transporter substrate-binding protein [Okeania sp. SIO2F4]
MADTVARYRQGKPILFFAWKPHWSASILRERKEIEWLNIPFTSLLGTMENFTEQETSWDGKNLGFAIDNIKILANKKFWEANPVAKRLLEQIEIPMEDVNLQDEKVKNYVTNPKTILPGS